MSHDYSFLISRLRNGNTSLKETLLPSADAIETLERERDEARRKSQYHQTEYAKLYDLHQSTPCEQIRHAQTVDELTARAERAEAALKEALEWYDKDGLVGASSGVLSRIRSVLEKIEGEK